MGAKGFLADTREEFIEHIAAVLRDEGLRRKMSAATRRSLDWFAWDSVIAQHLHVYGLAYQACHGLAPTLPARPESEALARATLGLTILADELHQRRVSNTKVLEHRLKCAAHRVCRSARGTNASARHGPGARIGEDPVAIVVRAPAQLLQRTLERAKEKVLPTSLVHCAHDRRKLAQEGDAPRIVDGGQRSKALCPLRQAAADERHGDELAQETIEERDRDGSASAPAPDLETPFSGPARESRPHGMCVRQHIAVSPDRAA